MSPYDENWLGGMAEVRPAGNVLPPPSAELLAWAQHWRFEPQGVEAIWIDETGARRAGPFVAR